VPQSIDIYDEALVDMNSWNLICPEGSDIGAGMGISQCYPEYANVYSFECYSGSGICHSWHPVAEAKFSRLIAYACAIRWDAQQQQELEEQFPDL
jgi:hypothetical protein